MSILKVLLSLEFGLFMNSEVYLKKNRIFCSNRISVLSFQNITQSTFIDMDYKSKFVRFYLKCSNMWHMMKPHTTHTKNAYFSRFTRHEKKKTFRWFIYITNRYWIKSLFCTILHYSNLVWLPKKNMNHVFFFFLFENIYVHHCPITSCLNFWKMTQILLLVGKI